MDGYNKLIRSQMIANAIFDDRLIKAKGEDLRRRGYRTMFILKSIFYKPFNGLWKMATRLDFSTDRDSITEYIDEYNRLFKNRYTFTNFETDHIMDGNKLVMYGHDLNGPLVEGIFGIEEYAL